TSYTGLLDPSRFSMHHMYSMQYTSGPSGSDMLGAYVNTMTYNFKMPMRLTLDLGYFFRPLELRTNKSNIFSNESGNFLVPRVTLDYQPSKNVLMSFQYIYVPSSSLYYSPYNPYSPFLHNSKLP
ncbi:MAG: hypothetical protein AB1633_12620, partial [Elusimicrobiota bacterium]